MNELVTEADALRLYPELQELMTMRRAGWVFRMSFDASGEPECLMASRSVQRYTDALFIHDRHTITGSRLLDDAFGGGCVWIENGSDLQEVVRDLLALPEPGEPGSPTLVRRSSVLHL
jgi:hypothetical protein